MNPYPLEDEWGDVLQKARNNQGYTLETLAEATGIEADVLRLAESYVYRQIQPMIPILARMLKLNPEALGSLLDSPYPRLTKTPRNVQMLLGEQGESNCYILYKEFHSSCLVIDPGVQASRIKEALSEHSCEIEAVLITHGHKDHTQSLEELGAVGVYQGQGTIQTSLGPILGMATPGHTKDSTCYLWEEYLFVGDLLFAGSIGRSPSPSSYAIQEKSLWRIRELPLTTLLFPGHGQVTSLAIEEQANPFFLKKSES